MKTGELWNACSSSKFSDATTKHPKAVSQLQQKSSHLPKSRSCAKRSKTYRIKRWLRHSSNSKFNNHNNSRSNTATNRSTRSSRSHHRRSRVLRPPQRSFKPSIAIRSAKMQEPLRQRNCRATLPIMASLANPDYKLAQPFKLNEVTNLATRGEPNQR